MTKRSISLIVLGVLAVIALVIVIVTLNQAGNNKSTIQENTKEIFSDEKTQKIEETVERTNKQKFVTQEF
jgi:uncharacterized membrane protein YvbJ